MNKSMASKISTSLIISTYNRSDALELCVKSVLRQSLLPDEIIIADDGSKEETGELIHQLATTSVVPIIHVWHEDLGFRLATIRNKAIVKATKEYIIQIDGDIVLHKDFVKKKLRYIYPRQRNKKYNQRSTLAMAESSVTTLSPVGHFLFQRM